MARINIGKPRTEATLKQNLGKVIIFCEGKTEYNYLNYFARILNSGKNKFTDVKIELEEAEGNAQTVLNCAEEFFSKAENKSRFAHYQPYLIFDCDDPKDIQRVIKDMKESSNEYELLLTNLLFELWLLMHFEEVTEAIRKGQIYNKLMVRLDLLEYKSKHKTSEGIIRKVIGDGQSVSKAIENAVKLEQMMHEKGYNILDNIENMNPYTTMHKIMLPISDELNRVKKP